MICLARQSDISAVEELCYENAIGCRILSSLAAYGMDCPFFQLWTVMQDNIPTGVICRLDSAVTVLCRNTEGYRESDEFIKMLPGVTEIVSAKTGSGAVLQAETVSYKGSNICVSDGNASDIYKIMQNCGKIKPDQCERLYVDLSHRIRHGVMKTSVVFLGENPVSCACAQTAGRDALITTVMTLPNYGSMGYATAAVTNLCQKLQGKNIYLLCEQKLVDFYVKMGFKIIGGFTVESTVF